MKKLDKFVLMQINGGEAQYDGGSSLPTFNSGGTATEAREFQKQLDNAGVSIIKATVNVISQKVSGWRIFW